MKGVDRLLDLNPELKELYNKKEKEYFIQNENSTNEITLDEYIEEQASELSDSDDRVEEQVESDDSVPNIKKIYRQIVKITHPDKVKNKGLNSFYIDATTSYNSNDYLGLYLIAVKLNLDITKQDVSLEQIEESINTERNKIKFIQSTYSWLWFNSDEAQREMIILAFIRNKIS